MSEREDRRPVEHMLEARSVALVGASAKPGSFGDRVLTELERSPLPPEIHLVNPRYAGEELRGRPVLASLEEAPGPLDLVLLAVGDARLEAELEKAARRRDRSAVIFSSVVDPSSPADSGALRGRIAAIAAGAGMALCGGGCMGFVSPTTRAIGYFERHPLPLGPIALVSHSGSAFAALLRTDRPFGWSLAVSSGQELVTTAAEYLEYALATRETRLVLLVLETLREPDRFRAALAAAAADDVPVVALTVGASAAGRAMVAAHSGALAGSDGAWEALFATEGVLRVGDLGELCDTAELLVSGRRAPAAHGARRSGLAAVLDSGAERALLVDVAEATGVGFAEPSATTVARLARALDPGLRPENPLDVWGRDVATEELFTECLAAFADDEAVRAVCLAVDLTEELDGDQSYPAAIEAAAARSELPFCVLSHVPSAIDRGASSRLRRRNIPVLEGTRSGLLALSHLFELSEFSARAAPSPPVLEPARQARWREALGAGPLPPADGFSLLFDYGIESAASEEVTSGEEAVAAAARIGLPVALKTSAPGLAHKSDVGGVRLGLASVAAVAEVYEELARDFGPHVLVAAMAPPGVEVSLGLVRDPLLGPLLVLGAGGVLVELLAERAVALPPLDDDAAARLVSRLSLRALLDGFRNGAPADLVSLRAAITAVSTIALELGDVLAALEVNPLSCGPSGVLALDVLVEPTGHS